MQFSKRDTLVVKGVAILFLIAYHCFSSVSRLNGHEVSFSPLSQKTAMYIFESMNICVGMFAFLSSYGLTKTMLAQNKQLNFNSKYAINFITKRTVSLIGSFLLPYILCTVPTLLFTNYNPYGEDINSIFYIIADMLGLGGLLGTPMMIGTWWYMSFALVIVFLMPLTVHFYKNHGCLVLIPYVILPVLLVPNFFSASNLTNMTRWLLTVPIGIIFADMNIMERIKAKKVTRYAALSKIIKFAIMTIILILLFLLRTSKCGEKYIYYFISSILPVYFICYLYEFIVDILVLNTILAFFGKHSSNIFFMHTFIRGVWLPDFTYSLKHSAIIFGFMLGLSLIMSFVVVGLKHLIRWDKGVKWFSDRLVVWENRLIMTQSDVS